MSTRTPPRDHAIRAQRAGETLGAKVLRILLTQRIALLVVLLVAVVVTMTTLTVAGFDYEVSTRATLSVDTLETFPDADEAADAQIERVLVSGRLLAEITRSLPAKPVDLAVLGPRVSIVAGSARFTLPTMPVEDYPPLPQMPGSSGTVV